MGKKGRKVLSNEWSSAYAVLDLIQSSHNTNPGTVERLHIHICLVKKNKTAVVTFIIKQAYLEKE